MQFNFERIYPPPSTAFKSSITDLNGYKPKVGTLTK